ncbi:MAG: carboxymethylenebutenolidase [Chloroflexota bacterium]|jgi:carboxymethylenebutenolidase|nr:carboxymethylenebutenolidase [Chloroflexota bacterium]
MAAPADTYSSDQITEGLQKVPGKGTDLDAIVARPKSGGPFPAVIIIHENMGIDPNNDTAGPHFENLAGRFARQGFVAVAPNFYQRGGTVQENPSNQVMDDIGGLIAWLRSQPDVQGKGIGVVGFCWGGGMSIDAAIAHPELGAAVIFYGRNPGNLDDVAKIQAPVMGFYGAADERISGGVPALQEAMQKHGKSYQPKIYPGAQHAFFNERKGDRHDAAAAADAWEQMLSFFNQNLNK